MCGIHYTPILNTQQCVTLYPYGGGGRVLIGNGFCPLIQTKQSPFVEVFEILSCVTRTLGYGGGGRVLIEI